MREPQKDKPIKSTLKITPNTGMPISYIEQTPVALNKTINWKLKELYKELISCHLQHGESSEVESNQVN